MAVQLQMAKKKERNRYETHQFDSSVGKGIKTNGKKESYFCNHLRWISALRRLQFCWLTSPSASPYCTTSNSTAPGRRCPHIFVSPGAGREGAGRRIKSSIQRKKNHRRSSFDAYSGASPRLSICHHQLSAARTPATR